MASADADATGSISPWSSARADRGAPERALAYAEQPQPDDMPASVSAAAPMGGSTARAAATQSRLPALPAATTVALKRTPDQPASTILTAPAKSSAAAAGAQFDDPWLRAVVVSPSVRRFLSTLALGAQDFRALTPLMHKPDIAVMMTFTADPYLGLEHDHFSGSAIMFPSTVTYATRTASLR